MLSERDYKAILSSLFFLALRKHRINFYFCYAMGLPYWWYLEKEGYFPWIPVMQCQFLLKLYSLYIMLPWNVQEIFLFRKKVNSLHSTFFYFFLLCTFLRFFFLFSLFLACLAPPPPPLKLPSVPYLLFVIVSFFFFF